MTGEEVHTEEERQFIAQIDLVLFSNTLLLLLLTWTSVFTFHTQAKKVMCCCLSL